ncbi:MAG TPA: glycosyltransferase [Bacilli bacterium]|nr:glycosyltransferase [Bacilli bacterium]
MKQIIYLTNAMHFNDFEKLMKYVEVMPNPSNQNFHYRFITSLTEHFKVKVISQRPLNHKNTNLTFVPDEYNHNFYYPGFHIKPIIRNLDLYKNSKEVIGSLKITGDNIVFVDLLNLNLVHLAKYIKRRYKTKVVGILTDNPHNLSDAKKDYIKNVEAGFKLCDGFVFLTPGLCEYANKDNRPYTIINGVLSYTKIQSDLDDKFGKYIYFAGALYEKYGVNNLIESFLKLKKDIRLVIAGHGPLSNEISLLSESHPRIDFVGSVSPYKSLMYAQEAFININPRPFNEELDKYSIPSKVIEFVNTGRPLVSCHHTLLENIYKDNVVWVDDSIEGIKQALETIIDNPDRFMIKAKAAAELGEQAFGKKEFFSKISILIKKLEE